MLRKHRIAEALLAGVIGLDLAKVHDEACRWEHVIGDEAERRIYDLLGHPRHSPYGTPIPGLEEFGQPSARPFLDGVLSLARLPLDAGGEGIEATVRRFGEPLQSDLPTLELLHESGIVPGARIRAERDRDRIRVFPTDRADGVELPRSSAEHLYVDLP